MRSYPGVAATIVIGMGLMVPGCSLLYPAPYHIDGDYAGNLRLSIGEAVSLPCSLELSLVAPLLPHCGIIRQARIGGEARLNMDCVVKDILFPEAYESLLVALDADFETDATFALEGYVFADGLIRLKSVNAPQAMPQTGITINMRRLHLIGDGVPQDGALHHYRGYWLASVDLYVHDFNELLDELEAHEEFEAGLAALSALLEDYSEYLPEGLEITPDTDIRELAGMLGDAEFTLTLRTVADLMDLDALLDDPDLPSFTVDLLRAIDLGEIPPPIFGVFEAERAP